MGAHGGTGVTFFHWLIHALMAPTHALWSVLGHGKPVDCAQRTGPAGLSTPFPHPRAAPEDRCAFSTRPTADAHQQLFDRLRRAGRGPPTAARPSLRKSLLERTYRKRWTQLEKRALERKLKRAEWILELSKKGAELMEKMALGPQFDNDDSE